MAAAGNERRFLSGNGDGVFGRDRRRGSRTRRIHEFRPSGESPSSSQTLARHSTITLTLDRYSHTYQGEASAALGVLPDLTQSARKAAKGTGTDAEIKAQSQSETLSPDLSPKGGIQANSVESSGVKTPECDLQENLGLTAENAVSGHIGKKATRGTRTRDLRFTKQCSDAVSGDDADGYRGPESVPSDLPSSAGSMDATDPSLALIIQSWHIMPHPAREAILVIVKSVQRERSAVPITKGVASRHRMDTGWP
jgi:hypothetical protein